MSHPQVDPLWRAHVGHLLSWTAEKFGGDTPQERGTQWGATVMSEQHDDTAKMASHTARYGATMALWYEATGDAVARESGARSLNWATYACRDDGIVAVSQETNEGWWFSDGYGDYIRHFLIAMAAVPEWAPRSEDSPAPLDVRRHAHRLRPDAYRLDDLRPRRRPALRLTFQPASVLAAGVPIAKRDRLDADGYTESPWGPAGSWSGCAIAAGASDRERLAVEHERALDLHARGSARRRVAFCGHAASCDHRPLGFAATSCGVRGPGLALGLLTSSTARAAGIARGAGESAIEAL